MVFYSIILVAFVTGSVAMDSAYVGPWRNAAIHSQIDISRTSKRGTAITITTATSPPSCSVTVDVGMIWGSHGLSLRNFVPEDRSLRLLVCIILPADQSSSSSSWIYFPTLFLFPEKNVVQSLKFVDYHPILVCVCIILSKKKGN